MATKIGRIEEKIRHIYSLESIKKGVDESQLLFNLFYNNITLQLRR